MLWWSASGDSAWIFRGAVPNDRTYIVPLPRGTALPQIPKGGFQSEEEVATLPGARRLDTEGAPGPSLGMYAFERNTVQRNLYRVPIQWVSIGLPLVVAALSEHLGDGKLRLADNSREELC
jgi:hypothetical protein